MPKKRILFLCVICLFISSCAQLKTRKASPKNSPTEVNQGSSVVSPAEGGSMDEHPAEDLQNSEGASGAIVAPKISVIISAGGAKSIAGLGVLKAFQKAKIPVYTVGGVEFGSLVAALYAKSNSLSEAEWQLSKIKDTDFSKSLSNRDLAKFLESMWKNESIESFSTPFSCTSLNFARKKSYVLTKGQVRQALSFCLPYPPLFDPVEKSYAAPKELQQLFRHQFRQKTDIIVFVNVLNDRDNDYVKPNDSMLNLLWVENVTNVASDRVLQLDVPARNYDIRQVSSYRELIDLGEKAAQRTIENLQKNFNL